MRRIDRSMLASEMAFVAQLTPSQARSALDAFEQLVRRHATSGNHIELSGFGLFECIQRDNGQHALIFRQALNVKEELNRCL